MEAMLELFVTASRWCRGHLDEIALGLMAALLVVLGPSFKAWTQQRVGSMNFVLRTLMFVALCAAVYGAAIVYLPPWLVRGLEQLNNYTLAPVLVTTLVAIGMLAERN
ncbi:conserved membrane hypothetical protein [Pseudomonas sp. OF001]|jgi:hypothetical protein|uniref:DUF3392 domain-containing protein n=1 Tax=unclassified Pseudomonas TaxID=196821 RepID=UPI0010A5E193|nr:MULTISPECIES: DUF3392 domain-containing protein [unclassified Pseudomonas]THG81045.1 DUF3392 domain-containing protein [Pseudomonas sp. A-1]WPP44282.1 DUF3392 domain-containing protein [Pseudomonas sp. AN-1]CAD5379078.1 conserved membrane hypothetical protein [Pseudomonas sp. OF001]